MPEQNYVELLARLEKHLPKFVEWMDREQAAGRWPSQSREVQEDLLAVLPLARRGLDVERVYRDMLPLLQQIEDDAAVDFLGTGSSNPRARREEKEWRALFDKARELLGPLPAPPEKGRDE